MCNYATTITEQYLTYCYIQKNLDKKTVKAYRIDLTQFFNFIKAPTIQTISTSDIESYIGYLNKNYKVRTSKRKIASLKSFFRFLEYKNIIDTNPFNKLRLKFREPRNLPKTIPLCTIETLLSVMYKEKALSKTSYKQKRILLDIAIVETLFSTGIRVSELCNLKEADVDLQNAFIRIIGKGSKERIVQLGSNDIVQLLKHYKNTMQTEIQNNGNFFVNPNSSPISDQAVRRMIKKYCDFATIDLHITPHMFRHTFATCLLEEDVDIRYIQEMLGHSSITVTEIYTHVSLSKQKDILATKHPRNRLSF